MSQVWEALDLEYAQERDVINSVDAELRSLRSKVCTTPEYIVELHNYLPCLEAVLKTVDGLEHLHSPSRVDFMAEMFDERTMFEWEYFRTKNTGSTYARFFAFLKDRQESSRSIIARLQRVEISEDAGNFALGTSSLSNVIHRTDAQVCRRCDTFSAREGVYTCQACGKGTPKGEKIGHCLEHCGKYLTMSPNDRSACIETASFCPIHMLESPIM